MGKLSTKPRVALHTPVPSHTAPSPPWQQRGVRPSQLVNQHGDAAVDGRVVRLRGPSGRRALQGLTHGSRRVPTVTLGQNRHTALPRPVSEGPGAL